MTASSVISGAIFGSGLRIQYAVTIKIWKPADAFLDIASRSLNHGLVWRLQVNNERSHICDRQLSPVRHGVARTTRSKPRQFKIQDLRIQDPETLSYVAQLREVAYM